MVMRDVVAFFGGLGILTFETIFEQADRPWLIAAALGLMGFPFASAVDKWLKAMPSPGARGGSRPEEHYDDEYEDEDDEYEDDPPPARPRPKPKRASESQPRRRREDGEER